MSRLSRQKGKRGERELAAALQALGYEARRGVQYHGGPDSPDVVCGGLPFHWEVKRTEQLRLHEAVAQAIAEAPSGSIPVVAHRRNRGGWVCVLPLEGLIALVRAGRTST